VVTLASGLASIAQSEDGDWYTYRAAKAALTQFTRMLAAELGREGFTCIVISPGWVRTDMGGPDATQSAPESVRGMLRVIERLSPSDNGKFLSYRGHEIPW
jgi:NAD(P)-dependent dehydrogenase (short-subunit alcohol dehydrogenase family)